MDKKAGEKRKTSGERSGSVASKRRNVVLVQRASIQQLWNRLPYATLIECFQSLDVRNVRRLTRVSKSWKSSLPNLPVRNSGILFLSWYKNGGEVVAEGMDLSRTDTLWAKDAHTVYDPDGTTVIRHAPVDHLSLPVLFGADLQHVKHVICDGRGFKHHDPMLKFFGWQQDSLLKKEPNYQMTKITLFRKDIDDDSPVISNVLRYAAAFSRTPDIDFVGSSFSFGVGLGGVWDDQIIPTGYAECHLAKLSVKFPPNRRGLFWEDPSKDNSRLDPLRYYRWHHRWTYEAL